ncbi:hypothetical protein AMECASPLE_005055 [Ameca splendens]|uniref:Uncharacterized protein n=1 Tax=Ameca splendens TaxID=208324 RepID=A0ABV0ZVV9_9TELE
MTNFSIRQSDGRVWVWRLPGEQYLYCVNCKVWWRVDYAVGLFCRSWSWLLSSRKKELNASADQEILENSMLSTLWEQFGDGPFLFQLVHKDMDELERVLTSTR